MTDAPGTPGTPLRPGAAEAPGGLRLVTLAERPDLADRLSDHNGAAWPEFMLHDPVAARLWDHLDDEFAAWQFLLLDPEDRIVAAGNSAPLTWDGTVDGLPSGWDEQFERTVAGRRAGAIPNTLGALQVVVAPGRQGEGLAGRMIEIFRERGRAAGLSSLIACVRPTEKHRYPLTPIERYVAWTREDGLPVDAWIRLHVRLGGRVVRPAPESMTIAGTVAEWERWTGLAFPDSGPYVLPFATNPIVVDREADRGVYHDANVWMVHDLA
jgi:hypothetical protein